VRHLLVVLDHAQPGSYPVLLGPLLGRLLSLAAPPWYPRCPGIRSPVR
jgi:hypothetical protein